MKQEGFSNFSVRKKTVASQKPFKITLNNLIITLNAVFSEHAFYVFEKGYLMIYSTNFDEIFRISSCGSADLNKHRK